MIQEADDLLALVDNLVVALLAGVSQCHGATLRILDDVLYADQEILNFSGLLAYGLGQDNAEPVWIGSLSASDHRHVGTIRTTTGENMIAG